VQKRKNPFPPPPRLYTGVGVTPLGHVGRSKGHATLEYIILGIHKFLRLREKDFQTNNL